MIQIGSFKLVLSHVVQLPLTVEGSTDLNPAANFSFWEKIDQFLPQRCSMDTCKDFSTLKDPQTTKIHLNTENH